MLLWATAAVHGHVDCSDGTVTEVTDLIWAFKAELEPGTTPTLPSPPIQDFLTTGFGELRESEQNWAQSSRDGHLDKPVSGAA